MTFVCSCYYNVCNSYGCTNIAPIYNYNYVAAGSPTRVIVGQQANPSKDEDINATETALKQELTRRSLTWTAPDYNLVGGNQTANDHINTIITNLNQISPSGISYAPDGYLVAASRLNSLRDTIDYWRNQCISNFCSPHSICTCYGSYCACVDDCTCVGY